SAGRASPFVSYTSIRVVHDPATPRADWRALRTPPAQPSAASRVTAALPGAPQPCRALRRRRELTAEGLGERGVVRVGAGPLHLDRPGAGPGPGEIGVAGAQTR
ncbi:hypothetical protein ABZX95_41160, partial [Streptomyces sp. NPDC004232]|uniref:hypothetical protein n=1 Tax=Streptomyces sp. NPDC004232 TaxID=3154454 RepID=UPI0033B96439